jgi:phage shock protein PspC (stress-responsive transcriptional regulator)
MQGKLYRSRRNRMLFGVCGGLAEHFNVDPALVRLIAVLLALINGVGIIVYLVLALVLPLGPADASGIRQITEEKEEKVTEGVDHTGRVRRRNRSIFGIALIVIGVLFLLASLNFLWWLRWVYLWPLALIAIGLIIILLTRRK